MRHRHRIAIAFLSAFLASSPVGSATPDERTQSLAIVTVDGPRVLNGLLGPQARRLAPEPMKVAGTSEPPGPGCPGIPGGPGPLPDDDDDDDDDEAATRLAPWQEAAR